MGEVVRARALGLGRTVALKILRRDLSERPSMVARFEREAQISSQLQHPGIVPVYEMGRLADGRPYFTMPEIRGRTMREAIAGVHAAIREAPDQLTPEGWSLRRLLEAFHRVCEAVAYAHHMGVVHRDLKPQNIMLGDYGEVLVLDWGIAKVVGLSEPPADGEPVRAPTPDRRATRSGSISGTQAYMAPEQARGDIEAIGPHSDVFALGAVLYEILHEQQRHEGPTLVPSSGSAEGPASPASVALRLPSGTPVPEALEAICLRALSPDPAARYATARELAIDFGAWLEGAKNLARARQMLAEANDTLGQVQATRAKAQELRGHAGGILGSMPAFVPVDAKRAGWQLEDEAAKLEKAADANVVRLQQMAWSALTLHADLPEAHDLLSKNYAQEHARAEAAGLHHEAAKLEVRLRDHDRGDHARYLAGDGALSLVTDPPGATADLHRYVLRDRRLQLEHVGTLGTTPLDRVPLAMGSYLVILRAEGRQEVRYPVSISRLEHWDGVPPEGGAPTPIHLPRIGELGPDEVYVPAGWFWSGGDAGAIGRRSVMPRRRIWLDGFAVRHHQVTIAEYVDFLNALVRAGNEQEALAVAPRTAGRQNELGTLMLERAADGTFFIPPNNYYGIPWEGHWPVIFVDWFGASAYTRFKAGTADRPCRLPTELEWEKAARGVDARLFPWGEFLDPTWCRMLETHSAMPTMAPAGTYEVDESVYGVRDMAGNQRDWCLDIPTEQGPPLSEAGRVQGYLDRHFAWNVRIARGGNFLDSPLWCWTNHRSSFLPHLRDYIVSFRTARSIAAPEPRPLEVIAPGAPPSPLRAG
jgi:eukaryotic-like serine/threonine-protein kinase